MSGLVLSSDVDHSRSESDPLEEGIESGFSKHARTCSYSYLVCDWTGDDGVLIDYLCHADNKLLLHAVSQRVQLKHGAKGFLSVGVRACGATTKQTGVFLCVFRCVWYCVSVCVSMCVLVPGCVYVCLFVYVCVCVCVCMCAINSNKPP